MDVVQTLHKQRLWERIPVQLLSGDRRRRAPGRWSYKRLEAVRHNSVRCCDANLLRRIGDAKNNQRRAEVLVQLADKTVAATAFVTGR